MSVALLFITHEGIATSLLDIGAAIIRRPNHNLSSIEIPMDADTETIALDIENKLTQLDLDDGVLFVTDIYGSTPSNVAQKIATKYDADLISGINLPMVIRLLNYRDENKQALIQKALTGAKHGIQLNNIEAD